MVNKLKQIITSWTDSLKKSSRIFRLDPYNNWVLLISIFIVINVFIISGKILEFYRVGSDEALLSKDVSDIEVDTINREDLNEVILNFEIRKANLESLKYEEPYYPDPSI